MTAVNEAPERFFFYLHPQSKIYKNSSSLVVNEQISLRLSTDVFKFFNRTQKCGPAGFVRISRSFSVRYTAVKSDSWKNSICL